MSPLNRVKLAVGVAGWSYADWKDTVYRLPQPVQPDLFGGAMPVGRPRYASKPLEFISAYVDMVEVNSSFYRVPSPQSTASWRQQVEERPGFFFTAKLNQVFTHEFRRDTVLAKQFRNAFEPLREGDMLRGLLAQFRYDTVDTPAMREHLRWIAAEFGAFAPLVVEVRHVSWAAPDALRFLHELKATVANLDYPTARDSFDIQGPMGGTNAYLRLHGRNRKAWFASNLPPYETYNYDYPDHEIEELAARSRTLASNVKTLTIVANNHYRGKAVSAALRIKAALLGQNLPVPPALLDTYPQLKRIHDGT
ncbi:MAG: DUF72 domain-containing protein [Lentisphaeria bacterium]|nr:DUF72 domain-containing protein [Lentisphaeria bacterium]